MSTNPPVQLIMSEVGKAVAAAAPALAVLVASPAPAVATLVTNNKEDTRII